MIALLSHASTFALVMLSLFTVGIAGIAGMIADAILRDLGFGAVLNGAISMSGAIVGVWTQMTFFPNV